MSHFAYADAPVPIREDLPATHRLAWASIARPGAFFGGAERVAIAAEVRHARSCALCHKRKEALSPYAVEGEHDHRTDLPAAAIEVIHRVVTDPGRVTRAWFEKTLAGGLDDGRYVELIGVLVTVVSIDSFHRGLGLPLEPLPEPVAGEPSQYRPPRLERKTGYVPMIPPSGATGAEADLWSVPRTANVIRALSLVPDAVRQLKQLSAAQYLPMDKVPIPGERGGRALERTQIELLAGRVSALNECFY